MAETRKQADSEGSGRTRSPRYPVIAIDEALAKVKAIYGKDRRALTTFGAILEHMGYKTKEKQGGRSARVVASLKQYGLLEGRASKYQVSDKAFRILEMPEDSPERLQLIKEAALSPAMISKTLQHYKGEIPSDTALRSHLIIDEKFNPDSAGEFIKILRRTMAIVNPTEGDYTAATSDEDEDILLTGEAPRVQQITPQNQPPKPPSGQRPFPLYLSKDREAVLYVPSVMTRAEYDLLKTQITNSLLVMEATSVVEPSSEEDAKGASA